MNTAVQSVVQVILKGSKLAMYQYLIKFTLISTALLVCFFQSTISSASVGTSGGVASSSSEIFAVSDVHVERVLFYGMQGNDVRDLQRELRTLPLIYPSGFVTGYFGQATLAGIKRFQFQEMGGDQSISTTTMRGVVDAHTRLKLHLRVTQKKCPQYMRSREVCLEGQYALYTKSSGVDKTLSLLRLQISDEPRFDGECHQVMHRIAHVAVHEFKNFGIAMYHSGALCQNGYYHGVVEEYLRNENVDALTPLQLRNFCNTSLAATSTATDVLNCVHGLGHALMYMTRSDLPRSLLRCGDILKDDMRIQCLTGAFMQESFIATSTKKNDLDKQILGCSQSSGDQDVCWISLSAEVMGKNGENHNSIRQFCNTLIDTNNRNICNSVVTHAGN